MSKSLKPFFTLSKEEKIAFFIKCQILLITHHSNSPFIFTKENIKERISYASEILNKYKGFCYSDDNVAILFNYIRLEDPKDPVKALKEYAMKEGVANYNCVVIDWATFSDIRKCLSFCKEVYNGNIAYAIYVKNGKPKVFKTLDLIQGATKIKML